MNAAAAREGPAAGARLSSAPGFVAMCRSRRMPSLFLRLLLCVALLFNGMGSAMASAHLAVMGLQAEATTAEQAGAQAADDECPHAARTAAGHGEGSDRSHTAAMPPASADADCFERCLDLCMQHCQALIGGLAAIAAPLPGAGVAVPVPEGQASSLPHPLLRPPIAA
jgi:hypothetical protein